MIQKKYLILAIKAVVSVALIAVVFQGVGIERAWDRLATASPVWLLGAAGVVFCHIWICAFRWRAVLKGFEVKMKLGVLFRLFYIGAFFNQALPSTMGGDAVRAYRASKSGLALAPAVGGVLLDRVATVLALILLVGIAVPLVAGSLEGNVELLEWVVMGLLAAAMFGTAFLMVLDRIPPRFQDVRGVRHVSAFAGNVRRTFLVPAHVVPLMAWSFAGHIALSLMVWLIANAIGAEIRLIDCIALFPLVLLIQTIPISIAGWGVREGAMVQVFALAGVEPDAALAISILFGIIIALVSLPGGWFWITDAGRKAERAVEKVAPESPQN